MHLTRAPECSTSGHQNELIVVDVLRSRLVKIAQYNPLQPTNDRSFVCKSLRYQDLTSDINNLCYSSHVL